jgi:light-regulated signal transduction histidine kinase (bacteriophytochrome)
VIAAGHDLQEPLKTVKAYTQLLAKRSHDTDPLSESVLTHIEGGVDQVDALVGDLLAYIRLSREENSSFEYLSIDTAIDLAIWHLEGAIAESGAQITRTSMPSLMASKVQIAQLFQNLISNAVKFRHEQVPPEVHISSILEDGQWHFSVRDNGIGFDTAHAEHIFEPFHRLNGRSTQLTGLGLAVCRRIVEHHGGRIWAEAGPGPGSTFHFTLPNAPAPTPHGTPPTEAA